MRLLLDENRPVKLKYLMEQAHDVLTVNDMGWNGTKNGKLLKLLEELDFDALITMDKNMQFQQYIQASKIQFFVLDANDNRLPTLIPLVNLLLEILASDPEEQVVVVSNK